MKSGTKPITIRLVGSMIHPMDDIIEKHETYSNKPDFIIWAMREYYNHILQAVATAHEISQTIDRNDPNNKGIDDRILTERLVFNTDITPELLTGDTGKPILIRVPFGFYENIIQLVKVSGLQIKSIQEFCRNAVAFGLKNEWDRISIFNEYAELLQRPHDEARVDALINQYVSVPQGK
jgi:hypothetical protein